MRLHGFNNGFQLADNQIRQNEANERYEAGVKKEESRYQDSLATNNERYQAGVTRQAKVDGMAEIQFNNSQEDRQAKKSALAVKQKRDTYTHNSKQRKDRYNDVMQNVSNAYSADKTGANIPQEQWMEWATQSKGTNAEVMFDIIKQEANQYLVEQLKTALKVLMTNN